MVPGSKMVGYIERVQIADSLGGAGSQNRSLVTQSDVAAEVKASNTHE